MTRLLYHPNTRMQLDNLVDNPKQAVLLVGEKGIGKHTAAFELAGRILGLSKDKLHTYQYLKVIEEGQGAITIDEIREFQRFIKLGVPGNLRDINRIILIEDASRLTTEAQNALLKMLEEPPERTMFVLTASTESGLLGTICSRLSIVPLLAVSKAQATAFFSQEKYDDSAIHKAYAISAGRPGLMHALLNELSHPMAHTIAEAKEILAEPQAQRLLRVDSLSKDKIQISELLEALASITHAALTQAGSQNKHESIKMWSLRQEAVAASAALFSRNAHAKLLLDDLFLRL